MTTAAKTPMNLHIWQWKNSIFARFARAFFICWHFEDVLVLSTTWNDLFCSCVDDVSIWWQMFNFVVLCPKRWLQFNSRMTLNNWKMIAETRSYIFRWRSRFRRRHVCLSSLTTWNNQNWTFTANVSTWRWIFYFFSLILEGLPHYCHVKKLGIVAKWLQ